MEAAVAASGAPLLLYSTNTSSVERESNGAKTGAAVNRVDEDGRT